MVFQNIHSFTVIFMALYLEIAHYYVKQYYYRIGINKYNIITAITRLFCE